MYIFIINFILYLNATIQNLIGLKKIFIQMHIYIDRSQPTADNEN